MILSAISSATVVSKPLQRPVQNGHNPATTSQCETEGFLEEIPFPFFTTHLSARYAKKIPFALS